MTESERSVNNCCIKCSHHLMRISKLILELHLSFSESNFLLNMLSSYTMCENMSVFHRWRRNCSEWPLCSNLLKLINMIFWITFVAGVLFHRAILMSGSALSPWALVHQPARYAAQVAHYVGCAPTLPSSHLLNCLREKPLEILLATPILGAPEFAFAFGPSVDGVVIDTGEPPGKYSKCSQISVIIDAFFWS